MLKFVWHLVLSLDTFLVSALYRIPCDFSHLPHQLLVTLVTFAQCCIYSFLFLTSVAGIDRQTDRLQSVMLPRVVIWSVAWFFCNSWASCDEDVQICFQTFNLDKNCGRFCQVFTHVTTVNKFIGITVARVFKAWIDTLLLIQQLQSTKSNTNFRTSIAISWDTFNI